MRRHKQDTTEYFFEPDAGHYYTGPARPPRRGSRLVAALLVMVIFLGGMASALGIVNFHLLATQAQNPQPMSPVDLALESNPSDPSVFLGNQDDPAPIVPQDRQLRMEMHDPASDMTAQDIYVHNEKALVSVYTTTHGNETISGTGVVLSKDGFILTNAHVIQSAKRVFVYLPDGRLMRAAVVGSDSFTDLAVLYIQAKDLSPAMFAPAAQLQTNDAIFALNTQPDAQNNFVLVGSVVEHQTLRTCSLSLPVLQTTLTGDGGPMFDAHGRIVAIQAGKIRSYFSDDLQVGLAIPAEMVQSVVEQLMENGCIPGRPHLGIQVEAISKLYQYYWELPGGLLVTIPDETCSAFAHGLQDGDILLALDGVVLSTEEDLYATLYDARVGDELIAAVFRDGRKFTITLTVEAD